jgi:hypothetical protein
MPSTADPRSYNVGDGRTYHNNPLSANPRREGDRIAVLFAAMLRTRLALRDRHHGLELASAFGSEAEVHGCRVRPLRSRLTPEQT